MKSTFVRLALAAVIVSAVQFAFAVQPVFAVDTSTRPVGPILKWEASDLGRYNTSLCEVKFVEGSNVRLEAQRFSDDTGLDMAALDKVLSGFQIVEIRPTFQYDRSVLRQWKAEGEARSGAVGPDLSLWFDIKVAGGPAALARLLNELNALPAVEIAHPVPHVAPAVLPMPSPAADRQVAAEPASPATPDFSAQQRYLYNPPAGLNATAAWGYLGGRGEGMHFIDVELCWTENHEDFTFSNNFYVGGAAQDPAYEPHGTAVLGEILGKHNTMGVKGFSPEVLYGVVAVDINLWPVVPQYFQEAVDHLFYGDVWLIELQMYPPGKDATPMEYLQVNYDVIWTSVWSRGLVCVEAGANGSQDLDDPSWGGIFDRNVRDSGAIMVGAGTPDGLVAEGFSNYGTRMDVHAWGSVIVTTGYGDLYNGGTPQTRYTGQFSGTSGASPMIVGSSLCLQGISRARNGHPTDPITLRRILHDTGTPQHGTRLIGPRPNLQAAALQIIDITAVEPVDGVTQRIAAFPNPFTNGTNIRFALTRSDNTRLSIFDTSGRLVRNLYDGSLGAGEQSVRWDSRDNAGHTLRNGVYFYRIETGQETISGRMEKIR